MLWKVGIFEVKSVGGGLNVRFESVVVLMMNLMIEYFGVFF